MGSSNLLPLSAGVQPPMVRDVGGPTGVVSRGCLVGDCAPSLLLPSVVDSVPEHDPVLVRYLLSRTLLDWETEKMQLEKEKEDGLDFATPPSPVVGTLPAQSGAPSSANVGLLDGTLKLRHCTTLFAMRFPPWSLPRVGNGSDKRQFDIPGSHSDSGGHLEKRVRLTKKTRPGVFSHYNPDPGHPTPRRWEKIAPPLPP